MHVHLYLMPNHHRGILEHLTLVSTKLGLSSPKFLSLLGELGDWCEVKVGVQMPEQGAGDSDERAIRELCLPPLHRFERLLIDDDLMEASLDQAAGYVLDLLASLHKEVVARGDLHRNAVASVARPDVKTWEAGTAVNGEEVEICMEPGKDRVLCSILVEIRRGRRKKVRSTISLSECVLGMGREKEGLGPVTASIAEVLSGKAEANRDHLGDVGNAVKGGQVSRREPRRARESREEPTHSSLNSPTDSWQASIGV